MRGSDSDGAARRRAVLAAAARWLGAAGAVASAVPGCAAPEPALVAAALPGFTLDLPVGARDGDATAYAAGTLAVGGLPGAGAVVVLWLPGAVDGDPADAVEDALARARLAATVAPSPREFAVPGLSARSATAVTWDRRFWVTAVGCGARTLVVMTGAVDGAPAARHARIVGSLRCAPRVEEEAALAPPAMAFSPPPGWEAQPASTATSYAGPEGAATFYYLPPELPAEEVPARIAAELRGRGQVRLEVAEQHGTLDGWRGELLAGDDLRELRAVLIPCGDRRVAGVYLGAPDFVPARAALGAARCR